MKVLLKTGTALAALLALVAPALGHDSDSPEPSLQAIRINPHAPKIDGVLDEEIWHKAPISEGFTQRDPDEGEPASERTTVQVAYDNEALYIGVRCYDSEPEKIVARPSRRDQWVGMDWVAVHVDPHHDHQTGFVFLVGASGWQYDAISYDDTNEDDTWNGVWESSAAIDAQGWSAEFRIPYHVLRFAQKDEYTWGINVQRQIQRKEERQHWNLNPRGTSGWVSRFGHLEGIRDVAPKRALELLPFAVGRRTFGDDSADQLFGSAGLDLRYGLTPNISLNAAVNPDFGQVEADPAVLNLSVFETFLGERRPFFVEGNTLFRSPNPDITGIDGPAQLFYSRRIGRRPGRFDLPDGYEEISRPDATTILTTSKLSGKTAQGTSFGILQAVTSAEDARIEDEETGQRRSVRIEPTTHYFASRLQQTVHTNSSLGATLTAVNGQDFGGAYTGSLDGTLKWNENAYRVFTRLAASSAEGDDGRQGGYEAVTYFSKFSGNIGGQIYADMRSRGFEVNELGFMNRNDRIQSGAHIYYQIQQPWKLARRSGFNLNTWSHWNFSGDKLARGINFNTWHNLHNYWYFNFGINRHLAAEDDLITRGGPVVKTPASFSYWSNIGSDDRKIFSFWLGSSGDRQDEDFGHRFSVDTGVEFRPASNIEFSLGPSFTTQRTYAQWVENIDDDGDEKDDHYVFGQLDSRVLDITLRGQVAFSNNLTLQAYLQSFATTGDYSDFKELARPRSRELAAYDYQGDNPDFENRSLRGNLVLRWEYHPGSTLYLVWSPSRSASPDVGDPAFRALRGVRKSFSDAGNNVFFVKLNYWSHL
jgi:hypothetical protein